MKIKINRFWSNEIKTRIRNEDYTLNRYILVKEDGQEDITIDKDNYLSSIEIDNSRYVPNNGVIGGFVAREATIKLLNVPSTLNVNNKKLVMWDVVSYKSDGQTFSEREQKGVFYVYSVEYKDTTGDMTIIAYDAAYKFNYNYISTLTFPCTAYQLLVDACTVCGMTEVLPDAGSSLTFTNMNFQIPSNQYHSAVTVDEETTDINSATCRLVVQDIAKLAFTFAYIDNYGKIQFNNWNTYDSELIDTNHYYTCTSEKPNVITYNAIVLGMSGVDGENVSRVKSGTEGDKPYYINDNNLTYTPELRNTALNGVNWSSSTVWEKMFMPYTPLTLEFPGYPWMENCDVVTITDVDNATLTTRIFNSKETYKGYLTQTIDSTSKNDRTNNEVFYTDTKVQLNQTRLIVDKANQKITMLASDTYTKSEIQEIARGEFDNVEVSYVATEQGTFDRNGIRIQKIDSTTGAIVSSSSSLFNEFGLMVQQVQNQEIVSGKPVFFSGYVSGDNTAIAPYYANYLNQSITATQNIIVDKYAEFGGRSRLEVFTDEDNIEKTGMFDIGG